MRKSANVFAPLRTFVLSLMEARRHRARFSATRLSVVGFVIGLATLSMTVLPVEIASAATSPNISAPPNVVVGEASGSVTLTVTLSAPGTSNVTVNYTTPGGGSCDNLFVGKSGTLTFVPGVTSQTVTITINNCGLGGITTFPDFTFTLSDAVNGTIINPSTQVDIIGDGTAVATPGLYARNAVVDNSAGNVMVPVLLGGPQGTPSASTVTVHYATANGSATAGTDYTATSGTLTFGPGQTAQNIVVPILDRSGAAASRSFKVHLSSPTNAVITQGAGVVTIGASGGTAVSSPDISAPVNTVAGEADGYLDLPVTLSAPGTSNVTVNYTTTGGGSCDNLIQPESGTLTFVPGVTLKAVRVPLNNCGLATGGSFTFTLSDAANGTISVPTTTVTIEGPPTITSFSPASGPVGTSVTITGTNLEGAISVTFNGTKAKVSKDTATLLKAKVPAKATTGQIVVTTQDGSVTSTMSFKVT
jgi:Calx-beta domain